MHQYYIIQINLTTKEKVVQIGNDELFNDMIEDHTIIKQAENGNIVQSFYNNAYYKTIELTEENITELLKNLY